MDDRFSYFFYKLIAVKSKKGHIGRIRDFPPINDVRRKAHNKDRHNISAMPVFENENLSSFVSFLLVTSL